jgi:hypothetical protein
MATITVDTFLDDGTARTAGEAWALNGGTLTVRTDTRWHDGKPAGMTGSIGAIVGSASLGGGVLIDGRNVREITFNSGSGTVPAIGTTITQGGISGYLLGVWPDLASAPITPGSAMPTTGFIKFREVTGGLFAAGALTGISANSDGADVPSWIEFVQRQATANTINRLNFFRTRGTWYTLPQTTSGSRNQIIQIPTNGGGAGTHVPAIWIETGVGTNVYESFPCIPTDFFLAANLSLDARSKFCRTDGNGQVRIGSSGVQDIGFLPPAGCRIRIPNVIGRQTSSVNDALNLAPAATLATRPDFTTTSSGVIDLEYFLNDFYFLFASPNQIIIKNSATFDILSTSNGALGCDIDNLVVSPFNATSSISMTFLNNPNGGTIQNSKFFRGNAASNGHSGSITLCSNYEFENCQWGVITYARSTGRSINMSQVQDTVFRDCYQFNGYIAMTTCARISFFDFDHVDRFLGNTNSTTGHYMLSALASSDSILIDGFTFGLKGTISDFCNPYLAILLSNASSNIKIKNGGTITNKLRVQNALNAPQYIIQDSGVTNGLRAQRIYLDFTRTGDFLGINTAKNIIVENCQGTVGTGVLNPSTTQLKGSRRSGVPTAGSAATVGTHFMDFFTSDLLGFLTFIFNEPTAQTAPFVVSNLTTANGGFNAAGAFVLPAVGDYVQVETPYLVKGHTAFRNLAVTTTSVNPGNFALTYDLDTGSGFSGTFNTLNAATLLTETISPTGFRMRVRATCTTANGLNAITYLNVATDSTFNAQRDNLYPLDIITINLNGLTPNSRVELYDVTNSQSLFNSVVAGTTLSFETEFTGVFNLRTRVMFATDTTAKIFYEDFDSITSLGITKTINQVDDDVYISNAIDGFSVSDISIVDGTFLVEIDSPTLSWSTIYAYAVAWLYTQVGIEEEGQFVEALDQANYLFTDFRIKNVSSPSAPLSITGGWGRDSVTGLTVTMIDNSGGAIFSNPDIVVPFSSGSGLSPAQDATLSKIDTLTENVSGLRFTAKALEESPAGGGGGSGDWTTTEKNQIRNRLGIDGTSAAPSAVPTLARPSDIPTAAANASAVRTELTTELGRVDVTISSRLATAGYTAPPSAASIRSEIDSNSTKLDVAVGTRLASAGYVAPANSDIAAIKARTDNLPSDPADQSLIIDATNALSSQISSLPTAPSASTVASAVRTELSTEMNRIDVNVSSRNAVTPLDSTATQAAAAAALSSYDPPTKAELDSAIASIPAAPSSSANASAVRSELATELARIDTSISSRNSVAPDNANIALIKAKVDTLENADLSGLATSAELEEVKKNTDLIPATV